MSKQQTYQAKSPGLIVLLFLFSSMGMKDCKKHRPPKPPENRISVSVPDTSVPKIRNETAVAEKNKDTIAPNKITPQGVPDRVEKKNAAVPKPKAPPVKQLAIGTETRPPQKGATVRQLPVHDSVPVAAVPVVKHETPYVLRVTVPEAEEAEAEIAGIERQPDSQLLRPPFFAGDTAGKVPGSNTASSDKLLSNTGSSYYTSEVQPNMNDQINSAYTTRLLYDSVIVTSNKEFVYNTLTINNTTNASLTLQVQIAAPPGWQMVTTNIVDVSLAAFASTIIPMRFSPSGSNTSGWQPVRIEYRVDGVVDSRKTFFRMKVQEYSGFKAALPNSNLMLTSFQRNVSIPVYVKNSGNTSGNYSVTASSNLLKIDSKTALALQPGKDTTLLITFSLSESLYSMIKKEDIRINVANEKGETINMIQSFSRVGYVVKDHMSAYLDMPLQLEAGLNYQGGGIGAQYYGALYGTVDFSDHDHFSMALRSNTIAKGQTNKNSMVRFDFSGEHIKAGIGNIQGIGEYVVDGYGARFGYHWKGVNKAEFYGMLKSRTGDTKVFGAALQTGILNKIRISDALSLNFDRLRQMNSGILNQITEIKFTDGKLALITGAGAEENKGPLAEGTRTKLAGSSLGYNFSWVNKHLSVLSNVLYNSNGYPGLYRGQRLQMHDARWLLERFFLGGYYEYNYRKQSFFQDSVLLTDIFNMKTVNYGARGGVSFKTVSFILAGGNQKQLQEGPGALQTSYDYLNLTFSSFIAKKLYFNFVSFAGYNHAAGDTIEGKALVSSTQGTLQYRKQGVSFRYDNGPYYYQEFVAYLTSKGKYERVMISPFAEFSLWKSNFNARMQGNYAYVLPADVTSMNVLVNINYSHPTKGFDFNINGVVPFGPNTTANNAYISASFRTRLKLPFVAVRKFYDLRLILFKDSNSNGRKDAGEEPVAGQTVSLNGDLFVSDVNGIVLYRNTEKGAYKADFGFSSRLKGWIPSDGTIQHYDLPGNRSIEVPYKVSRVLQGRLIVEKDSLSNAAFNPGSIKVMATGEKGEVYSTLTDEEGNFYFNLPAGNYIVSLSETAFSEQFRPLQFSQTADLVNNRNKNLYFEIKQKKRQINIKKK